jgi:hypothetical protein
MPRFCFFLNIDGRTIEDWSGRTLPDLNTALLLARQEHPRLSRLAAEDSGAALTIEIRDANGNLLDAVARTVDVSKTA